MQRGLEEFGAHVVGPAASVDDALGLLDKTSVDGAILDVSLGYEGVFPVAEALMSRSIPFVFATGYDASGLPPKWRHIERFEKPVDPTTVARTLLGDEAR
ncbi:response regulator [Sphingomonas sp. PB2P19]|uniref:response regulator n=1 Tax=Sphingomonas rhamnosi TaxID=3096156 RepID=UPI002FC8D6B3